MSSGTLHRPAKSPTVTSTMVIDGAVYPRTACDVLPSTMDHAVALSRNGTCSWTLVTARTQTSGRGTNGRTWVSTPDQGLWLSIILPPPDNPERMPDIPLLAAEMLVAAFTDLGLRGCRIKHPNDVLAGGCKIAGILCESSTVGHRVVHAILGMGVNLSQTRGELDATGLPDATSYGIETGSPLAPDELLHRFLSRFRPAYTATITTVTGPEFP